MKSSTTKSKSNPGKPKAVMWLGLPATPGSLYPVVRHHDEATMKSMLTNAVSWYDPASGEVVVRAARMKAMEQALNEILECSNGHFNPLFKCKCYDKAHALVMPNDCNGVRKV